MELGLPPYPRLYWAHGISGERGAGERGRKSQPRRRSAEKRQEERGGPGLPKASAGSWESSLIMCSEEQGAPGFGTVHAVRKLLEFGLVGGWGRLGAQKEPRPEHLLEKEPGL